MRLLGGRRQGCGLANEVSVVKGCGLTTGYLAGMVRGVVWPVRGVVCQEGLFGGCGQGCGLERELFGGRGHSPSTKAKAKKPRGR